MASEINKLEPIKFTEKRDGLRMMLECYRNFGALRQVSTQTGAPVEILKRFCNGEDCLTAEQDKTLRAPLGVYGSKNVVVSVDLKQKNQALQGKEEKK